MVILSKREYQNYLIVKEEVEKLKTELNDKPYHFNLLVKRTSLQYPTVVKYYNYIKNNQEVVVANE